MSLKLDLLAERVGGAVTGSKILRTVKPNIPDQLRGLRGTVLLEVAIGGDGKVIRAAAKTGPPELYAVSAAAVEKWLFKPTTFRLSLADILPFNKQAYKRFKTGGRP